MVGGAHKISIRAYVLIFRLNTNRHHINLRPRHYVLHHLLMMNQYIHIFPYLYLILSYTRLSTLIQYMPAYPSQTPNHSSSSPSKQTEQPHPTPYFSPPPSLVPTAPPTPNPSLIANTLFPQLLNLLRILLSLHLTSVKHVCIVLILFSKSLNFITHCLCRFAEA